MTNPRFLQIHTLHSYPAALLNRDDSGLAKRMPFGGATRTRISSQCLKRHWRVAEDEFALNNIDGFTDSLRTRNAVELGVMKPLRDDNLASEEVLQAVQDVFQENVYSGSGVQPLLLGLPEVEYLRQKATAICTEHRDDAGSAREAATLLFTDGRRNEERDNFRAFRESTKLPGGLISALFGRMVTSDPGANIDAAVHVAHAFTVHEEQSETDFWAAVEDLPKEAEGPGAAHLNDMELTAGLFYGYVVVDLPGLVSNLEGCSGRRLAYRRPGTGSPGGPQPGPPHCHRQPRGQAGFHRTLRAGPLHAGGGRLWPALLPGRRLPQTRQTPAGRRPGPTPG